MECLDANVVQDLMSGALDDGMRGVVLGHLDTCDECRELLTITAKDALDVVATQPYPDRLVPPRSADHALDATAQPATDIGLQETRAQDAPSGLEETAASSSSVGETQRPSDRLVPPRRAQTAPTAGRPFGRYALIEQLGAGAMGVVWLADDPKLGRKIALKLLKRADPTLVERQTREAQAMAKVSHPNVVGVFDVGTTNGASYIAMELVQGKSLRAWQQAQTRTISETLAAYVAAGRGLAAAHAAGIVHRDFKPDNVLVGDDGRVRVTDFGLAAAKPSESGTRHTIGDVNLTTSGSVLGTPAYMAPEQFNGGNVDSRTDQFNFCAALYEALYGERPFAGSTFSELADNVIEGRVKPVPAGTRVSRGLRAIVLRGLSARPGDRYPTIDHLLTELGRDRATPWRRTAIAAAALTVLLGFGLVFDRVTHDRLSSEIEQSFQLTGKQLEKTANQLRDSVNLLSNVAYREQALREVTGHHDQADFGLGTPEADALELEHLHSTLASVDWVRDSSQLAVIDYKGRLLYTSAAPHVWNTDTSALPAIRRALDTGANSLTVLAYRDPVFAATRMFGSAPPDGLAVLFARTLALGDKASGQSESRAIYLQILDGKQLLDNLRLDPETMLALVAPDGKTIGDEGMSSTLTFAAPQSGEVAEVMDRGLMYEVQAHRVPGLEGQAFIAQVVMARKLAILTLFPDARLVFALAALAALAVSLATALRARSITHARIS
jgi:serine/threonine protein kinase